MILVYTALLLIAASLVFLTLVSESLEDLPAQTPVTFDQPPYVARHSKTPE